ncbi:MAG: NAD(P)-dependent alcohol dehydrogenase, partial [Schleiferiaceae bacterium]|nr:NAD(P)-dependent alcohol dehydrogenase [Schleiferiaceae bacterium]
MKAIIAPRYGDIEVLKYSDVEKPIPKSNEVLIKVMNTTVTAGDTEVRAFKIYWLWWILVRLAFGLFKPRQP